MPASSTADDKSTSNVLQIPSLPSPHSRFVLPPPPSELLSRLEAFLPKLKQANEQLAEQQAAAELQGTVDATTEGVELEFISSSEEDSSNDSDTDEESSDEDEGDEHGQSEHMQDDFSAQSDQDAMARLLNINARPKSGLRKDLVEMEEDIDQSTSSS